jgi:hypothetical protein
VQRGRRIEASVQQAEKNVAATAASTAKTDADTTYREHENEVFGANHKANLANMASTDAANLINAQARMMDAQRMSSAAKTAEAELTALNAVDGAINSYIGSARRQLTNPEWRGLPSKIFSDGEDLLNRMPRNTQAQIKAHNAARQTWEEFRKDAKTSSDYAISRARQAHHSMGMSYISGVALDTYKRLSADPLKAEQAAEMVGKAATVAEFVAAGIPLSALVDPDQSREFFHYEQSKINPWHSTKSIGPNGQEIWTPIMEGDKAIPNMVLNVEQSRLLAQQYITKFKATQGRLTATETTRVTPDGGDALADVGGGGEGGVVTTLTVSGHTEGGDRALRETASLRTKLEAATTSEDIAKLLKDVTDPAADLWALTGEGSEQFGGSGMVGGSGDDNQPAALKALEKLNTIKRDIKEFSEEMEKRGGGGDPSELSVPTAPSDVPEGGVKPIPPSGMLPIEPVVGPSTVEPELAKPKPEQDAVPAKEAESVSKIHRAVEADFNRRISSEVDRAAKDEKHLPPITAIDYALFGQWELSKPDINYGRLLRYIETDKKYKGKDPKDWPDTLLLPITKAGWLEDDSSLLIKVGYERYREKIKLTPKERAILHKGLKDLKKSFWKE